LSLIAFEHRSEMIEGLQRHLIPAYYRLTSRLVNVNSYTETIKEEHADLFYLVKKALRPLEEHLGFTIPDSEVSYFVIHFGGYIEAGQQRS
ncbi:PRD domain-containing protein, partial [Streptococcus suis]